MNHFDAINCLILTDNNNTKQENPMIFKILENGVKSLKKLYTDTIRNPVDIIAETIFFLCIATTIFSEF
ncbi:TPA: hypothetical protein ACGOW8_000127 [Streptococcus suis]